VIRKTILAGAVALLALSPATFASAQSPGAMPSPAAGEGPGPGGQQAPAGPRAGEMPGPATEIVGPDGAFRLKPDGVTWERFQTVRAIGVRCSEKSCGGERVFCMIQVRGAEDARAGEPTSQASAEEFGAGVIKSSPKEMAAEYVTPFAEKSFGQNLGRWAELKAEGEPGSLRFGLFLAKAEKQLVAFNCVSPSAKWDENKQKFEGLLASLQITK
jgi:hypothetical protein